VCNPLAAVPGVRKAMAARTGHRVRRSGRWLPSGPPLRPLAPRHGGNARIQVTMADVAGVEVLDTTAPMNDAGGFSYAFEVPPRTAAGEAVITAMPFNIDWCDDTGRNNRVTGAGAALTLERVSCVIPMKPLTITR
jgi:hypothetical protein